MAKKRTYETTIQIPQEESSSHSEELEDYEEDSDDADSSGPKAVAAPAQDTKIVLNLFEDEISLEPPQKKKKVESTPKKVIEAAPAQEPPKALYQPQEPFFKSQLPPPKS